MANSSNPNFWESWFGINILNDNNQYQPRFINEWNNSSDPYSSRIWGQKTAVWVDTEDAYKHYIEIPELRMVIDKRASMMASNIPILYDSNGERIENHWFLDMIDQPNPTQSWSDVIYCLSVNDALWSSSFAYCPARSFGIRNLIVPLPSDKMKIKLSGKKLKQMDADGLISGFEFCYDEDIESLTFDEIIYLSSTDGINIVNPSSRIESLKYPLSNIKAQYHKRNVLLENIGAIGILSARNSDMGGAIPMTAEEKDDIRKSWYRRSKDEVIITESDVSWNPMSYPTKDLMLFEELNADKMAIIDTYGLNSYLFSNEKGSTFTNVKEGIRMAYQDTIIPETQQMYDSIAQQIGLKDEGITIYADFSHIPALQADENLKAQSMKIKAEAIEKIQAAGVNLSEEEIREISGLNGLK
tara:strand:- start:526 stop:1767 length:1242 start_codon:yes stop_codon:yes gene_type:complete